MPRDQWTIKEKAFKAIIDQATFDAAQRRFASFRVKQSDEELLDQLRKLLARKGRLSNAITNRSRCVHSVLLYGHRFGSLGKAYELIGYNKPECFKLDNDLRRRTDAVRERLIQELRTMYPGFVSVLGQGERRRSILQLPGFQVSVRIGREKKSKTGVRRWFIDPHSQRGRCADFIDTADSKNDVIEELHLFPYVRAKCPFSSSQAGPMVQAGNAIEELGSVLRGRSSDEYK